MIKIGVHLRTLSQKLEGTPYQYIGLLEEIGLERELMGKMARMKLQYFGHVTRGSAGNLVLRDLEGSVDSLRHQGGPKRWTT